MMLQINSAKLTVSKLPGVINLPIPTVDGSEIRRENRRLDV